MGRVDSGHRLPRSFERVTVTLGSFSRSFLDPAKLALALLHGHVGSSGHCNHPFEKAVFDSRTAFRPGQAPWNVRRKPDVLRYRDGREALHVDERRVNQVQTRRVRKRSFYDVAFTIAGRRHDHARRRHHYHDLSSVALH
jgi:hypothetical protein